MVPDPISKNSNKWYETRATLGELIRKYYFDLRNSKPKEYIKSIDFADVEKQIGGKVEIVDYGTNSKERCDYPVFAKKMLDDLINI